MFHERIESRDIDELNKASIYMMMAPIFTSAIVYGYSKMRESGGASSHLAQAIATAKEKFTPQTWGAQSAATKAKWPSRKPASGEDGDHGDEDEMGAKFDPKTAADAYK